MVRGNVRGMRPTPDKTAMKAEDHSKEGPINSTIGKTWVWVNRESDIVRFIWFPPIFWLVQLQGNFPVLRIPNKFSISLI